ncbi:MAG TPA: 1-deoxy-D-xylulose-5-phosphate synthase N-terminal domain-containing protein [Bacteroidota bacterium]|nr:1-deoxy-D-xylulose-5-phosphate synthase N-terminal domain-containing protein [Bacteroidota bacterium]
MEERRIHELQETALRVREHIIRMSTDGGCFIGASLSCADILVYMYGELLSTSPARTQDPARDYLFLSKGHDVPALYGTLAEFGYIDRERLAHHLKTDDAIYWHPNRKIPGVEFHSGSLGHLLSVAIGVALDIRMRGGHNRVYVVMGDGELNEGSVWEGLLVAHAQGLDNIVAVIDRNRFQANLATEELSRLEPLGPKFEAFGWSVAHADGHDFTSLGGAFASARPGRPHVVIAETVRGKGLPSIEARADRWFVNFSHDEVAMLLEELHGSKKASLVSATLMVR